MRTRLVRLAVVVLVLAGSLLTGERPASATTVVASEFWGSMETPGGMGDPCTPIGTMSDCRLPLIEGVEAGPTRDFGISSTMCVAVGVDIDEDALPVAPPFCAIWATGTITGFCGSASATGYGAVSLFGLSDSATDTFVFTWQLVWAGTQYTHNAMVLTGTITHIDGGPTGSITGRMSMTPDPHAGSCTNGTAHRWIVGGDMAIEIPPPV